MTWADQHAPRFAAITRSLPQDCETLLNVGAEPMPLQRELVAAAPSASHYGINLGDGPESVAYLDGTPVTIRECNIETDTWPFDTDSMDVVVLGAILEHLLDPQTALAEARRVTASDGRLILSTPNATRLVTRVETLLGRNPFDGFDYDSVYHRHNREWTAEEVEDILRATGWDVSGTETVSLARNGVAGAIYSRLADARNGWNDQLVTVAVPGVETRTPPTVCRESVVERGGDA